MDSASLINHLLARALTFSDREKSHGRITRSESGLGQTVPVGTFQLRVVGEGTYHLALSGAASKVESAELPAECTMELSATLLEAIVAGRATPQRAVIAGELKISGNTGLALPFWFWCL